jgi:putative sterol carrier protein
MVNEDLKKKMAGKIEEGDFGPEDLPDYMKLFCEICNESDDVQEEAEGVNLKFQFVLAGGDPFWLQIAGGKFTGAAGTIANPDNTLSASLKDGAMILTGAKDATGAYQSGALKVEGELPNAVKLRTFIEIVRDEIED